MLKPLRYGPICGPFFLKFQFQGHRARGILAFFFQVLVDLVLDDLPFLVSVPDVHGIHAADRTQGQAQGEGVPNQAQALGRQQIPKPAHQEIPFLRSRILA